ncbi:hypothetical protein [Saccharomonospora marina]|nr:hypothetical protein [Saccharomonospora marina]
MASEDTMVAGEFRRWARAAGREPGAAETVLELLSIEFGVVDPGELEAGDLPDLLLDVCPDEVDPERIPDVLLAVYGLLDFAVDTGRLTSEQALGLRGEVDEVAPTVLTAGADDAELFAVDDELTEAELAALDGMDDELDLREVFGLPGRLPPLRLPGEHELARAARSSPLLDRARRFAAWVGEGRELADGGDLPADDAAAAAKDLGVDLAELAQLWDLGEEVGFLEVGVDAVAATEEVEGWVETDDDDVLQLWQFALASLLGRSLLTDQEQAADSRLEFSAAGLSFMALFLAREVGMPSAELSALVREAAVADLPQAEADGAWQQWVRDHGDPATVLYRRLAELGAVEIDGEVVRLTPLGLHAMWEQVSQSGVEVPLLPPVAEMTAADVVSVGAEGREESLDAEWEPWLASREPQAAARELLEVASAATQPWTRVAATALAARLGEAALDGWRAALDDPALRPYSKQELAELVGAAPELELQPDDVAWLLADSLTGVDEAYRPQELADYLAESVPEDAEEVFERLWRLDHPGAHEALTLIGRHHPDKKVAKAARKAAFKVVDR